VLACDIPADPAWRREYSRQIVCLVTEELYSVLRRAASDHQTTMQLILRSGLALWFVAHGYTIPASDMQFPQSQAVGDKRRPLR
jgi:hypothetical protein